ncbi:M42 family metallopeptidase, partial [Clostridioides difficile]
NLRNKLVDVAEDNNLDYAVDVFTFYGSDASEAIRWGEDVQIACVGPGTNNSHHYERTHIEAIENTLKLLINYMLKE